jgi:putative flippase GtrA
MQKSLKKSQKRFLKFAIVGLGGTIVDFSFFNIFSSLFGFSIIPSSIISFLIAVINNFYWNRNWTYPESKEFKFSGQLLKFSAVSTIGLLIRTPLLVWIEKPAITFVSEFIPYKIFLTPEAISRNLALAFVIGVVLLWNYFINQKWTFKDIK